MSLTRLTLVLLVATLVAAFLSAVGIRQRLDWSMTNVAHGAGHMYVVSFPDLPSLTDTNERPERSPLRLHEDRRKLGPAHTDQAEIVAHGRGRFRHFDNHIYFAASDNTDVRTNGRAYFATYYRKLHPLVPLLFGALTAFLLVRLAPWASFVTPMQRATERIARLWRSPRAHHVPVLRAAAFACIASAAVSALLAWSGTERRVVLDLARAESGGGHMFAYELKTFERSADTAGDPMRSDLVLYEGTRRLGPAHSPHAEIMAQGAGRFSHYSQYLYFSSSDNSDVTKNGRHYSLVSSFRISTSVPLLFGVAALGCLIALAMAMKSGAPAPSPRGYLVAALRQSGGRVLLLGTAVLLVVQFLALLYVAPDAAATELDLFRRAARRVVSLVLVVGSGLLLARGLRFQQERIALAPLLGQALVVGMVGIIVSDRPWGFPIVAAVVALVAWLLDRRPQDRGARFVVSAMDTMIQRVEAAPTRMVAAVAATCAALTFINVLPEVVRYWDQSGWMDSHFYDIMAHNIARGTAPFGHGEYAPLYQYTMAALYWACGHFFFVQQIANVALACATALMMCWAAWLFFGAVLPVLCVGLLVAYVESIHHAVWYTQIENLYLPVFAASILALAYYLRRRDARTIVLLGVAASLVFATRQQGAFYIAALPLVVLLVRGLTIKARLRHIAVYGAVFVSLGVLPWSLRNWHVEDRFSASSAQSTAFLAIFNDPRIPFHAIRYWERSPEVRAEWMEKYPDARARSEAMQAYFWRRLLREPEYFVAAAPWRLAAFYGLLPGAYLGSDWSASRVVTLAADWVPHWRDRFHFWGPLLLSLIAVAWRWRSRTTWLLVPLIGANVAVGLLVGSAEPRGCYPVLLLHFVLLGLLTAREAPTDTGVAVAVEPPRIGSALLVGALAALILGVGLRATLGSKFKYREIPATRWLLRQDVKIDVSLPLVSQANGRLSVDGREGVPAPGQRYRGTFVVSVYMFPPRYITGLPGFDANLPRPESVQYYYASHESGIEFPLRYDGAQVAAPLKEHDIIEAEFTVDAVSKVSWMANPAPWSSVEKAIVVGESR